MKNVFLLLTGMAVFLMVACNTATQPSNASAPLSSSDENDTTFGLTRDLIDTATANSWVRSYDSLWKHNTPDTIYKTNFFTVRTQDVIWSMGTDSTMRQIHKPHNLHPFMRVTFGYNPKTKQMKAFFQAVDSVTTNKSGNITSAGIPLYFDKNGKIKKRKWKGPDAGKLTDDKTGDFVADLNTPCPPMCNQEAPIRP